MVESSETVKIVVSIIFFEHTLALVLHCVGLCLLLTTGRKAIATLLIIQLSFAELCYTSYDGFFTASHYIKSGHIPFINRKEQTIFLFIYSLQFLTLIAISVDRVLAVKLALRYKILVRRRALAVVIICIWITSLALALIIWFIQAITFNKMLVALESLVIGVYICSYGYIIFAMRLKQTQSRSDRKLSIKVPFLLVLTLICFLLIPDLVLAAGYPFSIWFLPVFWLNNISDALIYIFEMPVCRKRMKTPFL